MSSRNCPTCPLDVGIKNGGELAICGSPSPRCINFRGQLLTQINAWEKFSAIGEIARSGMIELDFLKDFKFISIMASKVGKGFNEKDGRDRVMIVRPEEMQEDGLRAKVMHDTYNNMHPDYDDHNWRVPEDSGVIIHGSHYNGSTRIGQIHLGRPIAYTPDEPQNDFDWRWGMVVQEVQIWDERASVYLNVFGTDLSIYQPPRFDS
ncbi:MAG TPA: hypothetical protein VLG27_01605 [Candidatus Saccharimonadia bacterium]|nr:hypothetical protein [Candidatus Saccharimonadia bacterium]